MNLLVIPVTFYAVQGLTRVRRRVARPLALGVLLVTGALAGLYVTSTPERPYSPYGLLPNTNRYAPSAYLRSTVPLGDTFHVHAALTWLNARLVDGSCLLTRETFTYWAIITLDPEKTIVSYGTSTVEVGLQGVSTMGFDDVYWIWWEDGVGQQWYQQSVPAVLTPIHRSGAIVIFKLTA